MARRSFPGFLSRRRSRCFRFGISAGGLAAGAGLLEPKHLGQRTGRPPDIVQSVYRQVGIQCDEGIPQPALDNHLSVVVSFCVGRFWSNVRTMSYSPAEFL